jgi:hypothetical protein
MQSKRLQWQFAIHREINETARILKERHVIRDTATVVDETARTAIETAQTVKVISKGAREAAPETSAAIATASETAKERTRIAAEKAKHKFKKGKNRETA